jgi:hypothetical protein
MFAKFGSFEFTQHDITARAINGDGEIAFRAATGGLAPGTGIPEAFVVLVRAPEPGAALQSLAALAALRNAHRRRNDLERRDCPR